MEFDPSVEEEGWVYSKSANSIVAYIPVLKSIILSAKLESIFGSPPG